MENDDYVRDYRLTQLQHLADVTARPVRAIIDVGTHNGDTARLLAELFPFATVHAYDVMADWAERARQRVADLKQVTVFAEAVVGDRHAPLFVHRHVSDERGRATHLTLGRLPLFYSPGARERYDTALYDGPRITLADAVTRLCTVAHVDSVDLVKLDCEGSEVDLWLHTPPEAMERIRTFSGELHTSTPRLREAWDRLLVTHHARGTEPGMFFAELRSTRGPYALNYDD